MNICFSYDHLYPASSRAGRHIETLARRFTSRGHRVFAITTPVDNAQDPEDVTLLRLREAPGAKGHNKSDALQTKAIARFLRQNDVQVLFAEGVSPLSAVASKAAKPAGARTIIRVLADAAGLVYSIGHERKVPPSVLKKRMAAMLEDADAAAASSERCAQLLKEYYDGEIVVIEKCVDLSVFRHTRVTDRDLEVFRDRFNLGARPVIVYGREEMRAETILSTLGLMRRLVERKPELVYLIVGQVDNAEAVQQGLREASLMDNYRLVGTLSQRDSFAAYVCAPLYLAPYDSRASESELLEAMAMRCAIVCSGPKAAGAPSVIQPDWNSLVFDSGDEDGAAQRIAALLDDPAALRALCDHALETARGKDIATAVEQVEELCEKMLGLPDDDRARSTGEDALDLDDETADETPVEEAPVVESARDEREIAAAAPRGDETYGAEAEAEDDAGEPESAAGGFGAGLDEDHEAARDDADATEGGEGDRGERRGRRGRRRRGRGRLRHDEERAPEDAAPVETAAVAEAPETFDRMDDDDAPDEREDDLDAVDADDIDERGRTATATHAPATEEGRRREEDLVSEASKRLRELDPKLTLKDLMPFLRPPKDVYIMSLASGSGHHRAGEAVFESFKNLDQNLRVRQINILDYISRNYSAAEVDQTLDELYQTPSIFGAQFQTGGPLGIDMPADPSRAEFFANVCGEKLKTFLLEKRPDQLILTHFLPLKLIAELKKENGLRMRVAVVVTDYDFHPYWLAEGVDQYLVPSEKVRFKMIRAGALAQNVEVVGVPVHPRFEQPIDGENVRRQLGVRGNQPTILLRPGGIGPTEAIIEVIQQIANVGQPFNLLVLAGKNDTLQEAIRSLNAPRSVTIKTFGFVNNIHEIMGVSDLMITRATGYTVAEAYAAALPMVLLRPTPGVEERTADWFVEHGVAIKAHDSLDIEWIMSDLLRNQGRALRDMRQRALGGGRPKSGAASLTVERIAKQLH
jgi:processive 1,2-diacylglycerol beta-glucosyltransferase